MAARNELSRSDSPKDARKGQKVVHASESTTSPDSAPEAKRPKKKRKLTEAQRSSINGENGPEGKGCKTPEGLKASSANALKRGLCSVVLPLPTEDPDEIDAHFKAFHHDLLPQGSAEQALVTRAAQSALSPMRATKAEHAVDCEQPRDAVDIRHGTLQ